MQTPLPCSARFFDGSRADGFVGQAVYLAGRLTAKAGRSVGRLGPGGAARRFVGELLPLTPCSWLREGSDGCSANPIGPRGRCYSCWDSPWIGKDDDDEDGLIAPMNPIWAVDRRIVDTGNIAPGRRTFCQIEFHVDRRVSDSGAERALILKSELRLMDIAGVQERPEKVQRCSPGERYSHCDEDRNNEKKQAHTEGYVRIICS